MVHVISYDIRQKNHDYEPLYAAIKKYGWCHLLESVFLIDTVNTIADIRDELRAHMHADDSLMVIRSAPNDWGTWNIPGACIEWLKFPDRRR